MTAGNAAPPQRRVPADTQRLVDLVLNPQDPGYEAAARRKAAAGTSGVRRWYDRPAVMAGCLVIGFLLAVAWVQTHRSAPEEAKVHDSLVNRVRAAETTGNDLAAEEARLTARAAQLQRAALGGSTALTRALSLDQLLAGEVAATGPGLQVTLSDPATAANPTAAAGHGSRVPASGGHILLDRDVRSVVNQLWADGAEAIAVNGIRLTPTSAIRFAGDAVLVDFNPIASPYVIDAIGNADSLDTGFAGSSVASRYQTLAAAKGIGFSFAEQNELALPAAALPALRYAHSGTAR